ncbi:ABC transporter permease subunit [Sporichthya polymorpha]|uniref:branched-chain amino acid ABC transporter permease n=1 Tax=Sporichthya polymorpha TaxID=35751 RepID=UPI0003A501BC|nr:ABC transporter permease [Sporichthya polymorpha]
MNDLLPYVIFGVTAGAIYGLSAMGLVLTYKTSGLFNFGHGAVSAAAAFVFYSLHVEKGMPWPLAVLVVAAVFGPIAGLLLERMAAVLADVPVTYKIAGTVGLLVGLRGLIELIYGPEAKTLAPFLPQGTAFSVDGVRVTVENLITVGVGVAAAVGLYVLFRVSKLGVAMRGAVDDSMLLDMTGYDPAFVRRISWMIGGVFAAVSGVLFASAQGQLDVDVLSLLVVQAFGAAAIGRFASLPLAFIGGIGIGVVQKLVSQQVVDYPALTGLDLNVPFLALFAILLFTPRGKLVEVGRSVKSRAVPVSRFRVRTRVAGYGLALAVLLAIPTLVGAKQPVWNLAMAQVLLFLSLGLLVRVSGQISLCQVGFAAVGAAAFGHLLGRGVPWLPALLIAGLITIPVGAFVAIPAIRLSGLYLALATFGFGVFLAQFFYTKDYMFGFGQKLQTHRPAGFESEERYYYVLLAVAIVGSLVVAVVERSRLGRLLRALSDSPTALVTLGVSTTVTLVLVFCLSAAMAGVSGAMYAGLFGSVGGFAFPFTASLIALAVLTISGRATIPAAFVAPVLLYVVPAYLEGERTGSAIQALFGFSAIVAAAASQGGLDRWFGARAVASADRRRGPAGLAGNLPGRKPRPRTTRARTAVTSA